MTWSDISNEDLKVVVALVLGLLICFLSYYVFRVAVRGFVRAIQLAVSLSPVWLAATAGLVALLAVPGALAAALRLAVRVVSVFAYLLPTALFASVAAFLGACSERQSDRFRCFVESTVPLQDFWRRSLTDWLDFDPAYDLTKALAIFIGIQIGGLLLAKLTPFLSTWSFSSARAWGGRAIPLSAALLAALYLVLTSIVATPIFEQPAADIAKVEQALQSKLEEVPVKVPELQSKIPGNDNSIEDLRQLITMRSAGQLEALTPDVTFYLGAARESIQKEADSVAGAVSKLTSFQDEFSNRAADQRNLLVSRFQTENRGRLGGTQTEAHADALVAHYRSWLAQSVARARLCSSTVTSSIRVLNAHVRRVKELVEMLTGTLPTTGRDFVLASLANEAGVAPPIPRASVVQLSSRSPDTENAEIRSLPARYAGSTRTRSSVEGLYDCDFDIADSDPPQRHSVVDSLGIFGVAASWLLRTESPDLSLITGLLGFGLFGALSANFIRPSNRATGLPSVEVIAGVFVRGIAAAILIYLVVVGGLAVFTKAEPNPSPYAVFFACFVAAVFSEDVWRWARQRQQGRLEEGGLGQTAPDPKRGPPAEGANTSEISAPDTTGTDSTRARRPSKRRGTRHSS